MKYSNSHSTMMYNYNNYNCYSPPVHTPRSSSEDRGGWNSDLVVMQSDVSMEPGAHGWAYGTNVQAFVLQKL